MNLYDWSDPKNHTRIVVDYNNNVHFYEGETDDFGNLYWREMDYPVPYLVAAAVRNLLIYYRM